MNQETTTKSKFSTSQNKGFQMTFENGLTISVQWGEGNYCSRQSYTSDYMSEMKKPQVESEDAEIAIWDDKGKWFGFGNDIVKGWCSPDEVAQFIIFTRGAKTLDDLKEICQEYKLI